MSAEMTRASQSSIVVGGDRGRSEPGRIEKKKKKIRAALATDIMCPLSLGTAMVPVTLSRGNGVLVSNEPILEEVEDGKLFPAHDVRVGMILHFAPDLR